MSYIIGGGGKLSGGKTVTFIKFLVDMYNEQELKIISNIKLKHIPHIHLTSDQFILFIKSNMENQQKLRNMFYKSIVFIDEARNLFSARKSSSNLNEMMTSFIMMLGKLNCYFFYTFQVWDSMIDKQLREISHLVLNMERIDENGNPVVDDRKVDYPIFIKVNILIPTKDELVNTGKFFIFNPNPYFKYYDTEEIVLVNREKYLSKR